MSKKNVKCNKKNRSNYILTMKKNTVKCTGTNQ